MSVRKEVKLNLKKHNEIIQQNSQNWGKVKFKPKPTAFASGNQSHVEASETSVPWKHIKNNMVQDEIIERDSSQLNMESSKAKEFIQKRQQNHRRFQIEANRTMSTKWEKFSDEKQKSQDDHPKLYPNAFKNHTNYNNRGAKEWTKSNQILGPKKSEDLTFTERNKIRRLMTKATIKVKGASLRSNINDFKINGVCRSKLFKSKTHK